MDGWKKKQMNKYKVLASITIALALEYFAILFVGCMRFLFGDESSVIAVQLLVSVVIIALGIYMIQETNK